MPLVLRSEPFSPDGNLSAEGFENLLGTPSLDLLAVLMRESVQNSCDATSPETGRASVYVRIRELTPEQRNVCSRVVFGNLPEETSAAENLRRVFSGERVQVLEIADYGTTGLGGPARANQPPKDGENADFVNFFRNVGAARDVEGGGGTYGYGKATLYRASQAHCIIADTLAESGGQSTRRFMAAQMGKAIPGRFTGRHWWGASSEDADGTVDPVTGGIAERLSERLGMPKRNAGSEGRGTTIMILAPHLPNDTPDVINALTEYLLWYFWPRMMSTTPRNKALQAFVAWGNEDWRMVPAPEKFAPLDLLCKAMNSLRGNAVDENVVLENETLKCRSPKRDLGQLSVARGRAGPRRWLLPPRLEDDFDDRLSSIIPERLHHVALMRPAQLVVRYESGTDTQESNEEWGGVFMCSEDADIESAFAKSEPPAHDDWQPESLPKRSHERRFVNVALRRIREKINARTDNPATDAGEDVPLARPSTAMGSLLPGSRSGGAGRSRAGSGGGAKRQLFTQPSGIGLTMDAAGNRVAEFQFEVSEKFLGRRLEAIPVVMIDGNMRDPDEATGFPKLLEWIGPDDSTFGAQSQLTPHVCGDWTAKISVPDDVAVGLRLKERGE
jgi:hypothetical protein